jgi:hypothetical protein
MFIQLLEIKKMKIFNGTQHQINLYNIADCYEIQNGRKLIINQDAKPVLSIDAGSNINATKGNAELPDKFKGKLLPLVGAVIFSEVDLLPHGYDLYIVSNLYRAACVELGLDTSSLATVNGVVYSNEGDMKPCGCTTLAVG